MLDQTVFELTEKGHRGLSGGAGLSGDARIILPLFGQGLTVAEVAERLPPSVRACCVGTVRNLLADGYIVAVSQPGQPVTGSAPAHSSGMASGVASANPQPAPPPAAQSAVTVVEDDGLDFTGKFHTPDPMPEPEEEQTMRLISKASLASEIEARAQQLAQEKFRLYEIEMSNSLEVLAGQDALRQEQEAQAAQRKMVESAQLSPLYDILRASSFFADFSDAELAEVLHVGVWHEAGEHQVLFNEGDTALSFFVMLKGLAGVFKRNRLIGLIQAGDSFGEIALLSGSGAVHHADVVSRAPVEYMEFDNAMLKALSSGGQLRFASAFSRCQTRRLAAANEQIVNLLNSAN